MAFVKEAGKSHGEQFAFSDWTTRIKRATASLRNIKHGKDNEIHAVTTLVGRFLPIFPLQMAAFEDFIQTKLICQI